MATTDHVSRRTIPPLRDLPGKVWRRLRRYYRRYFQNRNHVFVRRGPYPLAERDDCSFHCYPCFDDVPVEVRRAIITRRGRDVLETDRRELDEGAVMWIAEIHGTPASVLFTRRGGLFRDWFVPLDVDDMVIFRVRTDPQYRGRGLAPSLMRRAMAESLSSDSRAYVDCRVYNRPSIRSIEKAGFERIATMRPIERSTNRGERGG